MIILRYQEIVSSVKLTDRRACNTTTASYKCWAAGASV